MVLAFQVQNDLCKGPKVLEELKDDKYRLELENYEPEISEGNEKSSKIFNIGLL